jgi:hypothetical protein
MIDTTKSFVMIANPKHRGTRNRRAPNLLRNSGLVASDAQGKAPTQIVGSFRHKFAPMLEQAENVLTNTKPAPQQDMIYGMEPDFKLRHNAEIAAATPKRPEEIRIFFGIRLVQ